MSSSSRRQFLQHFGLGSAALCLPACGGRELLGADGRTLSGAPRGLHVSLAGDPYSSRTLTWFTDGLEAAASVIEYDQDIEGLSSAEVRSLPMAMRAEGSAEQTTGIEALTHRATATGLDPERPLRYRVGSAAGWSEVHVLKPTPRDDWSFVHYGDQGTGPLALQLGQALTREDFDLLLLAGDLSYANGDQPIWDTWFDQMEPVLANWPTMAAPGNHEEKDFGGDAFKNRFTHPKPMTHSITGGPEGSSFYSFDYKRVHFLVTTAGALINDGTLPEEIANIELDLSLAAARRAAGEIDFIVVMQHFTIWSDQLGRSPANPSLVALEEDIIVRYGVDLLLVGHDHVYQRSVPMAFGLPNPLGYVQMMVGTGGASVRLFDEDGPQAWSARQFVGIGYARYAVSGRTIRGEFIGAPPLGLEDELRQSVTAPFRSIDSFELRARSPELARAHALPARPPELLLANFDAIARHTRARNARALNSCA